MALRRAGIALLLVLAVAALGWSEGQTDTKERVTIRMFTTDSGVPVPQGVDPSDNWLVNILEEYANVGPDPRDPRVPGPHDQTAAAARLAEPAGHRARHLDGRHGQGRRRRRVRGPREVLRQVHGHAEERSPGPRGHGAQPQGPALRHARLNTATLGDMVNVDARRLHREVRQEAHDRRGVGRLPALDQEDLPELGPHHHAHRHGQRLVDRRDLLPLVRPAGYDFSIRGGHVVRDFTLPEYTRAHRHLPQMYAEGMYDKEFMNNQTTVWVNKIYGKDVVLWSYMNYQVAQYGYTFSHELRQVRRHPGRLLHRGPAPGQATPPASRTSRYTYPYLETPIHGHRIAISVQTKYPDRAWKVIEGFADARVLGRRQLGTRGHPPQGRGRQEGPDHRDDLQARQRGPQLPQLDGRTVDHPRLSSSVTRTSASRSSRWARTCTTRSWPARCGRARCRRSAAPTSAVRAAHRRRRRRRLSEARSFISQATWKRSPAPSPSISSRPSRRSSSRSTASSPRPIDKWVQANKAELKRKGRQGDRLVDAPVDAT